MSTPFKTPPEFLQHLGITPEQLADLFWEMDDEKQAAFFNHLGVIALSAPAPFSREVGGWSAFDWQMYHAAIHTKALPLGRRAMQIIGEQTCDSVMMPYDRDAVRSAQFCVKGSA